MQSVCIRRSIVWLRSLRADRRGQDIIEYALMSATVAVAVGAIFPPVSGSINIIFSKIASLMLQA